MTTASLLAPMMAWWTSPTRLPGHGGERSPPSTRPRSSTSTTRCRSARASGARCCAARACTARISRSGARPATPAPATGWRRRRRPKRSAEQVELERLRRRNERLEAELAKHEIGVGDHGKSCTRSWKGSPRARTPTRSRSRDRPSTSTTSPRSTSTKQACALLGRVASDAATGGADRRCAGPPAPRPAPPNKLTEAERQQVLTVLRSRGVLRPGPGPGVGPAARRRHLPVLDLHHVPAARRRRGEPGTAPPAHPPGPQEARADRHADRTRCGRGTSPSCRVPTRGVYYELFVIIDIFSRYVVGLDGVAGRDRRARRSVHRRHPRHATASTATSSPCTPTGARR